MSNIQNLIEETFSLLQEPVYVNIKYDGQSFKIEMPVGIESSVVGCGPPQYFDLEKMLGACLLRYVMTKTELKTIKEGA